MDPTRFGEQGRPLGQGDQSAIEDQGQGPGRQGLGGEGWHRPGPVLLHRSKAAPGSGTQG